MGNITAITDTVNSNQVQTFGYDVRDRLVWARTNGVGNGQYNEAYGYDRMGNIITRTVGGAPQSYTYACPPPSIASTLPPTLTHRVYFPLVMRGYGPESPPMAACVAPFAVVSTTTGFRAVYDPNGNMTLRVEISGTQRITYTQAWDAENRLAVVTNTVTGQVTRFVYDGNGNRVLRIDGSGTRVYIGDSYEKQGAVVTKYYYVGGQRIAVRQGSTLSFLHGDHLGSATVATDANGNRIGELRYTPYGVTRYEWGNTPTDRRYTGQPWEGVGLYDYGARMYSPSLGRFVSADTLVPKTGNAQSLNRYSYCLGNPLKYTDPTGHQAWIPFALVLGAAYVGGRAAYEAASVVFIDSYRRDQVGGRLVTDLSDVIQRESVSHSVAPALVSAVLRHESAAFERRLLTLWPTMQPGLIANTAEFVQSELQGEMASIGPGQMQLRRARELEELGYVTARKSDLERRLALLNPETSVEYVAGMLQYLTDQLSTLSGFSDLSPENRQRVILIGYHWGWESLREYLEERSFWRLIQASDYDNQTLDEYMRWSSGR